MTSGESATNREAGLREYIKRWFEEVEELIRQSVSQLEQGVMECLLRRDETWKKEVTRLKATTPISRSSFFPTTPADIEAPPSIPQASYSKLPINLEFPTFGEMKETRDILEFTDHHLDQCFPSFFQSRFTEVRCYVAFHNVCHTELICTQKS